MTEQPRAKTTNASTSGSFAPRARPDGDAIRDPAIVAAVNAVRGDLELLTGYDRGELESIGRTTIAGEAAMLLADGCRTRGLRAGVAMAALHLAEHGLEVEPGQLAIAAMLIDVGREEPEVAESVVARMLERGIGPLRSREAR